MKKVIYLAIFSMLVGCSSKAKFGNLTTDNISVDPKVLEVKGGEVTATIKGTFPHKFFPKDGELEVTPVLISGGKTVKGDKVIFFGEQIAKPGLMIVSNKEGGTFSEKQSFPYTSDMRMSQLYAEVRYKRGNESFRSIPRIKLADGVITTPMLVDVSEASMVSREFFGASEGGIETGTIQYVVGKSELRESELSKPEIQKLLNDIKSSGRKSYIQITSAASPEGAEGLNSNLAKHRDAEASEYVAAEMRKFNVNLPIKHTLIDEDWDGLYANIAASNMKDKDQMIKEMKAEGSIDKRQVILHKYMASNGLFEASLLPPLRRSNITLHIVNDEKVRAAHATIKSKTEREISKLSLDDRLAVTEQMLDPDEKIQSYRAIIVHYPNDWRAYNNAATVHMYQKNWNDASTMIDRSIKVQDRAENRYNQGFVHLAKGNIKDAKTCFSKASASTSPEWQNAKGANEIFNGEYAKAVATYGDKVCNNAALAQILNKDYSKAKSTLSKIEVPNATTYYLKAVLGARTSDKDMVYSNLKEVLSRDKAFGQSAKSDIEFAKYMQDAQFTSMLN
ncbi:MAG: hypothetical protein LBR52_07175 [Prevotellaceae bacterium]|nr:hypothetical protein [Prevotellaceae bacterium]